MSKTQQHKFVNHPLYIEGRNAVSLQYPEGGSCYDGLVRKWKQFCAWSIKNGFVEIESVTRETIILYGHYLKAMYNDGKYASTDTVFSKLYAANKVMFFYTNGLWVRVRPVKDCGINHHSYISPKKKPTLPDDMANQKNFSYFLDLQIALGLPFSEACRLDLMKSLKEGIETGFITTTNQSSGKNRKVPCRPNAIEAISKAIHATRNFQRFKFKQLDYNQLLTEHKKVAASRGFTTDSARIVYAQDRYNEIIFEDNHKTNRVFGLDYDQRITKLSELLFIPEDNAKKKDKSTRIKIANELGELGTDLVDKYLKMPLKKRGQGG